MSRQGARGVDPRKVVSCFYFEFSLTYIVLKPGQCPTFIVVHIFNLITCWHVLRVVKWCIIVDDCRGGYENCLVEEVGHKTETKLR